MVFIVRPRRLAHWLWRPHWQRGFVLVGLSAAMANAAPAAVAAVALGVCNGSVHQEQELPPIAKTFFPVFITSDLRVYSRSQQPLGDFDNDLPACEIFDYKFDLDLAGFPSRSALRGKALAIALVQFNYSFHNRMQLLSDEDVCSSAPFLYRKVSNMSVSRRYSSGCTISAYL